MCLDCYNEYEDPTIDTPAVREAARAIADVYEWSCSGGNLHVAIDDFNLGDDTIRWSYEAIKENVHEAGPEQLAVERRCLDLLAALTEDERASALGLHDGYWGDESMWKVDPKADEKLDQAWTWTGLVWAPGIGEATQ